MNVIKNGVIAADELIRDTPEPLLRRVSNAASAWCLCEDAACRRAQTCRGKPQSCLMVCGLLLSESVWSGALLMVHGQINGLSFAALLADWPEELEALGEWVNRVERGRRTPTPQPRTPAAIAPPAKARRSPAKRISGASSAAAKRAAIG